MTPLAHATLQRLRRGTATARDQPVPVLDDGPAVPVQFNPASLRISRSNNTDRGGTTTLTQKRQYTSQEGATLAFDLEFDTAEQGGTGDHVDVRKWTALVRQFVEPPPDSTGDPPPVVRFVWGTLRFNGIVTQVTEELDYFAPDGTPLRARVGVTIAEQDFRYQANEKGPGVRDAREATDPGQPRPGTAPGTAGTGRPRQVVQAQEGESAQQLLARLGLDPAAWRGAMRGLDSPLSLPAGAVVQLGAEVSAGGGGTASGQSAGFAGAPATASVAGLAAALGLGPGLPRSDDLSAGFALSAGGGIATSADSVLADTAAQAVGRAQDSFAAPPAVRRPGVPQGLAQQSLVPQGADRRSAGYGRGIPLRVRADPGTVADGEAGGGRSLAGRARPSEVPPPVGLSAPWEQLPPPSADRRAADCEQRRRDAGPSTLRWRPQGA
ncbi:hypothetical protein ACFC1R_19540 [Kitasatospora sp. NPDC056138]|uniref:CIS tube protein n=1 Tax=Kitasatospora sp. NPDC056138 TaxID=3345724 RepID=UPI0035E19CB6